MVCATQKCANNSCEPQELWFVWIVIWKRAFQNDGCSSVWNSCLRAWWIGWTILWFVSDAPEVQTHLNTCCFFMPIYIKDHPNFHRAQQSTRRQYSCWQTTMIQITIQFMSATLSLNVAQRARWIFRFILWRMSE